MPGVLDGLGQNPCRPARLGRCGKDLAGHETDAVTLAAAASNTANTFAIVVYGRDYSGNMAAVTGIVLPWVVGILLAPGYG